MDEKLNFGLIIFLIIFAVFVFFIGYEVARNPNKGSSTIYQMQIDSLQNKLDSLYDVEKEVDLRIDTITIEIEKTKIEYEKRRDTILNNTPSDDYKFFTNYINSNRERLYNNK